MLLRESMGIGADSSLKAFAQADITALFARKCVGISRDFYETYDASNTNHVILSVDPAGGGASAFAVSSIVQLPTGQIVVRAITRKHPSYRAARLPTILPKPRTRAQSLREIGSCP